jgi:hypothetical protein
MENLGIIYDHLVYFTAIGINLWPFGKFCGNLVYCSSFGTLNQEKCVNPGRCASHDVPEGSFLTRDRTKTLSLPIAIEHGYLIKSLFRNLQSPT